MKIDAVWSHFIFLLNLVPSSVCCYLLSSGWYNAAQTKRSGRSPVWRSGATRVRVSCSWTRVVWLQSIIWPAGRLHIDCIQNIEGCQLATHQSSVVVITITPRPYDFRPFFRIAQQPHTHTRTDALARKPKRYEQRVLMTITILAKPFYLFHHTSSQRNSHIYSVGSMENMCNLQHRILFVYIFRLLVYARHRQSHNSHLPAIPDMLVALLLQHTAHKYLHNSCSQKKKKRDIKQSLYWQR